MYTGKISSDTFYQMKILFERFTSTYSLVILANAGIQGKQKAHGFPIVVGNDTKQLARLKLLTSFEEYYLYCSSI